MRNSNNKSATVKLELRKCNGICKTYNELQTKFAKHLEGDNAVADFECNVVINCRLKDGVYTTDFVIKNVSGETVIRECVFRTSLMKPKTAKMLDASRDFWLGHGVKDWGIVIDAEK